MKIPLISKKWLLVPLSAFIVMLSITLMEVNYYYPKVKSYFDNTKTLSSRSLAARARRYVTDTIELISDPGYNVNIQNQIEEQLDIAYGFLSINHYMVKYQCTTSAQENIDQLFELIQTNNPVDFNKYVNTALPIIQCTETIQIGENEVRSELATNMLKDIRFQLQLMIYGTLLALAIGIVFWVAYIKQKQLINENRDETHKWIKNAMEDALTGAKSRRAFDTEYLQYSNREEKYSLLMCDIDYFKQYNDSFGHPEGDKILKQVTKAIQSLLGKEAHIYRYGGEELVVILDKTDKEEAKNLGLLMLESIRDLANPHPQSPHQVVTMSIGCASNSEIEAGSPPSGLIKLADERLYAAKAAGRNCLI